ncbi:MAG: SprT-like domain-containing protein [Chitinispirillales bacterium]|jgi:hypothetical protein|nr:SprT-like domain-containing protein [Chitinispirillales bacterium]
MWFSTVSSKIHSHNNPHISAANGFADASGNLKIVISKRLKKSWRVKVCFRTGDRVLTLPSVLENPPQEIKSCLLNWAMLPVSSKARRSPGFVRAKRELENMIRAYMESCGVKKERVSRINPLIFEHQTKGFNYNLQKIFDTVNRAYFKGEIRSYIRWGQNASRTSYQTIRIDKDGNPFNLITISGVYDSPLVPEHVIYGLVYHEMLHIAIPPRLVNGRRVVHGKDFKLAEKKYPFYDQWIEWERENMGGLLAKARKRANKIKNKQSG